MEYLIPHNYFFTFDLDHMINDMRAFDPLEYRYQIAAVKRRLKYDYKQLYSARTSWEDDFEGRWLSWLYQFELLVIEDKALNAPGDPIGQSNAEDLQNLRLIYGESEPIDDYLRIYDLVQTKFVRDYLAIDGLAKIMSKEYFKYEWEMQLQFNYDKQQQSYLRDHFIHQIKDMYEIFRFFIETIQASDDDLEHTGYMEQLLEWVNNGSTQIGDYIMQHAKQEINEITKSPLRREIYVMLFGKLIDTNPGKPFNQTNYFTAPSSHERRKSEKNATDHIARNIIQSALMMSALFHDIGYPIAHTIKNKSRLSQYLPSATSIISAQGSFAELKTCLSDSLLFRIEGSNKVERLYNQAKHGTLSALAFLLSYYESGSIQKLSPEKKAAVELAALIMSDHTDNYMLIGDDADKYRLSANRNPLSFLLKFCDEIQEWGREYFFVSENKSLRICNKCKKPIVTYTNPKNADKSGKTNPDSFFYAPFEYRICGCHKPDPKKCGIHSNVLIQKLDNKHPFRDIFNDKFQIYTNISSLSHRKINHVAIADRVRFFKTSAPSIMSDNEIEIYKEKKAIYLRFLPLNEHDSIMNDDFTDDARSAFIVQLDYNLYNLLQYSFIDPGFSLHRSKDINKLKKMLDNNKHFPATLIYADVTSNPISLKAKILDRYLYSMRSRLELAIIELFKLAPDLFEGSCTISEIASNTMNLSKYYYICLAIYQTMYAYDVINKKSFAAADGAADIREEITKQIIMIAKKMKINIARTLKSRYNNKSKQWHTDFDLSCLKIYMYLFSPYLHGMAQIADIESGRLSKSINEAAAAAKVAEELDYIWEMLYDESFRKKVVLIRNHELFIASLKAHNAIFDVLDEKLTDFRNSCDSTSGEVTLVKLKNAFDLLELFNQIKASSEVEEIWHSTYESLYDDDKVKLDFYFKLIIAGRLISVVADFIEQMKKDDVALTLDVDEFVGLITNMLLNDNVVKDFVTATQSKSIHVLIKDYITQESRQIRYHEHAQTGAPLPDSYYKIFEHNDDVVKAINEYSDSRHYAKALINKTPILDNFSDLLLFWKLSKSSQ